MAEEDQGRTVACWDAQTRSSWEHGAKRPRDPCSTLNTWALPIYVHGGPLPPEPSTHTQAARLRDRIHRPYLVRWSGGGEERVGSSADPGSQEKILWD